MKKLYEEPIFDLNKFSFEEILSNDYMKDSNPEDELGTDGGNIDEDDPFA